MNPILNQLQQTPTMAQTPQIGQIKSMMNMLQVASNPQAALQSILVTNPQLKELIPLINKNGGDYKKTFYDLAAQRGVNPEEVLKLIKDAS